MSKERDAIIKALYTRCQTCLDNEDFAGAFKMAGLIMRAEQGTSLEIINRRLMTGGITAPFGIYVEQKEGEVDIISDEEPDLE